MFACLFGFLLLFFWGFFFIVFGWFFFLVKLLFRYLNLVYKNYCKKQIEMYFKQYITCLTLNISYTHIHKHGHFVKICYLFVSILTFHTTLCLIQIRNQFLTQMKFIFMPLHFTFVIWGLFLSRQYLVSLSIRYFMLALFT